MKYIINGNSTDQTITVFVQDSSSPVGAGLTGLVYNSAGLTCYYVRTAGTATAITLATLAAANSTHADGGFKEVDATSMPGVYRLDLPDAVVAASALGAVVMLKGAANMVPVLAEIQIGPVVADVVKVAGDGTYAASLGTLMSAYQEDAAIPANVVQISGDTAAADNAEAMFDGTGYAGGTVKLDVNVEQINANSTAALNAEKVFVDERYLGVDVALISGDGTAAENAEAFFDGTGYAGGAVKLDVNVDQIDDSHDFVAAVEEYIKTILNKVLAIGTAQVVYMSSQVGSTLITIYQGDSYYGTKTQKLRWAVPLNVADLTGATVTFKLAQSPSNFTKACSVTGAGVDGSQLVELQLTAAETAAWAAATGVKFEVEASWSGPTEVKTIDVGTATITAQLT